MTRLLRDTRSSVCGYCGAYSGIRRRYFGKAVCRWRRTGDYKSGKAGLVSPVAGCFFAGLGHYILAIFKSGCEWVLSLPHSVLVLGRPKLWQVILYYLLLIMFSQRKSIVRCMQKIIDNGGIDIAVRNGNTHKKTILISTMRTAGLIGSTKAAQKALTVMNVLLRCMLAAALVVLVYRNRNGLELY